MYKYMPVGATNANPNPRLDTPSAEPLSLALARSSATGGWWVGENVDRAAHGSCVALSRPDA